jgi:hypothetical protein
VKYNKIKCAIIIRMRENNAAVLMSVDERLINELFIYFVDIPFIPIESWQTKFKI